MSAVLEVADLAAGYDGADVIRGIGFAVAPGEVVALLGPNGAGKTTLLRAVTNAIRRSLGAVTFNGSDTGTSRTQQLVRSGMSHVPEGRGIFATLTVAEHFRVGRMDVAEAFEMFPELGALRDRRAGLLSGGEQQMLVLASALVRKPSLLLVDELSLGLAPIVVERLLPIVRDYAAKAGAAVILVEQHVQLALDIADRGLVMAHGELVLDLPAAQLRSDRALLTASYLGGAL
ncbi:ABC transporter ATP-binding protein [uncultured Amnibacterium sp.]|uniref:ABC transporter ATP-binding protein n=1 Tax=uncultured Amnibacterium sp. TaxID=1631851 RepID=UPI0035C98E30